MILRVQDPSPQVQLMSRHWPIVDALMGGTFAMRQAKKQFLPQWPAEDDDAYAMRLATATLFPAFRRTLLVMAGKPFSKQITMGDEVPEMLREWLKDADMQGNSLHVIASQLMREALAYGLCGVLVENVVRPEGLPTTLLAEQSAGIRPYLVPYKHDDILGWRHEKRAGKDVLTQLRLREAAVVPDGEFGTKEVQRVRVLEPGTWQLYEKSDKDDFQLIAAGTTTLSEIPFVPMYGLRKAFMSGESPLLDLAYLNVKHWQSQSDQDTILHVSRVPILAVSGANDDTQFAIGSASAVKLPTDARMWFVEHSGAAIGAGVAALESLEKQMIQTGAELLVKQSGQRTATESANDAEANKSELLSIVEGFEDALDQCLQFMADWAKLGDGGTVTLFKDFASSTLTDASAQLILSLQGAGLITKATAIREQQRRGMLAADIDPELEVESVSQEAPAVALGDDAL